MDGGARAGTERHLPGRCTVGRRCTGDRWRGRAGSSASWRRRSARVSGSAVIDAGGGGSHAGPRRGTGDGVAERAEMRPFATRQLPFLAANDLAVLKALFDRPKDWLDIAAKADAGSVDFDAVPSPTPNVSANWCGEVHPPRRSQRAPTGSSPTTPPTSERTSSNSRSPTPATCPIPDAVSPLGDVRLRLRDRVRFTRPPHNGVWRFCDEGDRPLRDQVEALLAPMTISDPISASRAGCRTRSASSDPGRRVRPP